MMNEGDSGYVAGRIASAVATVHDDVCMWVSEMMRPSTIHKPRLSIDGNQWCALYGEDLHDGIAGFGDSPALAMRDFDKAWNAPLPARKE